jgi:hypothetical protein
VTATRPDVCQSELHGLGRARTQTLTYASSRAASTRIRGQYRNEIQQRIALRSVSSIVQWRSRQSQHAAERLVHRVGTKRVVEPTLTIVSGMRQVTFSNSYTLSEIRGPRTHLVWRPRGQTAAGVA